MPGVLRMDGLSALGLKSRLACGVGLPSRCSSPSLGTARADRKATGSEPLAGARLGFCGCLLLLLRGCLWRLAVDPGPLCWQPTVLWGRSLLVVLLWMRLRATMVLLRLVAARAPGPLRVRSLRLWCMVAACRAGSCQWPRGRRLHPTGIWLLVRSDGRVLGRFRYYDLVRVAIFDHVEVDFVKLCRYMCG